MNIVLTSAEQRITLYAGHTLRSALNRATQLMQWQLSGIMDYQMSRGGMPKPVQLEIVGPDGISLCHIDM